MASFLAFLLFALFVVGGYFGCMFLIAIFCSWLMK